MDYPRIAQIPDSAVIGFQGQHADFYRAGIHAVDESGGDGRPFDPGHSNVFLSEQTEKLEDAPRPEAFHKVAVTWRDIAATVAEALKVAVNAGFPVSTSLAFAVDRAAIAVPSADIVP